MKVLLVNGSPNKNGCIFTGLEEIAKTLNNEGIATEIFHIGQEAIGGCIGCGACRIHYGCHMFEDVVNEFLDKVKGADGFVFGSPVHYAGMSGAMKSFMDRLFFAGTPFFRGKPGAIIASCRRGGASATLDGMMKYLSFAEMPVVSGRYWNMIHGKTREDVLQDLEGLQNLRFVGKNMAWLLYSIEAGKKIGIELPPIEEKIATSFIR